MSRLPTTTSRRARPALLVGCVVLAVLAVMGTAPPPQDVGAEPHAVDAPGLDSPLSAEQLDGQTFADLFDEMRAPETSGEGHSAVAVASAPPTIPEVPGSAEGSTSGSGGVAPAPTAEGPEVAATVEAVRPSLVVRGVDPGMAAQIEAVDGVLAAAGATVGEVAVSVPGGSRTVSMAAVEPRAFRPLTPEMTADEPGVWERLLAGDAAFTHDAGTQLAVPLGSTVTASAPGASVPPGNDSAFADADPTTPPGPDTPEGSTDAAAPDQTEASASEAPPGAAVVDLRLGALASNGIPPVADALVSAETGAELGLTGPTDIYIGVGEEADGAAVRDAVAELTGTDVEVIEPPETQTTTFGAFLVGAEARSFFEPFDYIDHGDGLITIEQDWVDRNIASTNMIPLLDGTVTCHRQMLIQLYGAMSEVEAAGLGDLIDPSQYGGCWVARHIDWSPSKPISMHGWGLAVDLNVSTNQLGAQPTMDPRIVEIFDRWGFVWGGRWSRPDGMHFELGAVIDVPVPDGFFG